MSFPAPSANQQTPGASSTLKQRLLAGETSYGLLLCTASSIVAEIVSFCGYDVVVVDADHSPADTQTSVHILQALGNAGSYGIVRVPENSPLYLKKALDIGPAGVIIPTIDSADAAKRAVASCKYPPLGIRGYSSPTVRASMYGLQQDYMRRPEENPLIIAQIESELAVGRITEIAAVEGIDCIMVSPDDLATSIGKFPDQTQEDVQRLVRRAEEAVVTSGKLLGSFMPNSTTVNASDMFMRGYSIVIGASDVSILRENARSDVARVKGMTSRQGGPGMFPGNAQDGKGGPPQGNHPMVVARVPVIQAGSVLGGLPQVAGLQGGLQNPLAPGAVLLQASAHHQAAMAAMAGQPGMSGMQFTVSRRGGRGTPKRCSHCHMPLKEGHKEDCVAWERKLKMKKLAEGIESGQIAAVPVSQVRDTELAATPSAGEKSNSFGDAQGSLAGALVGVTSMEQGHGHGQAQGHGQSTPQVAQSRVMEAPPIVMAPTNGDKGDEGDDEEVEDLQQAK